MPAALIIGYNVRKKNTAVSENLIFGVFIAAINVKKNLRQLTETMSYTLMRKYIVLLVIFALIEISLAMYLTFWRENFWNAVSNKESLQFMQQLGIFTIVALVICFVSGISGYLLSLAAIKWRILLNERSFAVCESQIENINQRIQEDCWNYPDLFLSTSYGLFKAIVYVLVFSISMMLSFSWFFLFIIALYGTLGTVCTHFIAKPLIKLNYEQQRVEATYRNNLSIDNFGECIRIMLGLAKKQKHLTYFQQFYSQVGVVVPLIIIAPTYFMTGMTIGELMRFNSLGATILENLSYGITSFAQINRLISCRRRLKEARII